MRPTRVVIDRDAIGRNVGRLADLIAPSQLCAVVKADGYGHGAVTVAQVALASGASSLAVAMTEEGLVLRDAGVTAPILILSEPVPASLPLVVDNALTPTIYSDGAVLELTRLGMEQPVHVKVDTGMHRVGLPPTHLAAFLSKVTEAGLVVEGVWTHFAAADTDPAFTRTQIAVFNQATQGIETPPIVHLANTAAAVLYPETRRTMCRIGIGLYGLHPCDTTRKVIDLEPAMSLVSVVESVHPEVGSGAALAAIPIGFADGYRRSLAGRADVLINGSRYPVARVDMNHTLVAVDFDMAPGDRVVLIGEAGGDYIGADDLAASAGTITYEVVTRFGRGVPRVS